MNSKHIWGPDFGDHSGTECCGRRCVTHCARQALDLGPPHIESGTNQCSYFLVYTIPSFAEIVQEMHPESHRSEFKPIWPSTTGWQLMGHDAASLQAADPPRQRVSELVAHADTASLLSLMCSAMPQKNLEFLGPRSGARKRTRICTPGSETRPEIGTRTWGHEIHVFSYKK